ncbi:MAG: DUF1611 domain-containing protein [Pseudomonadota bacterium]
MVEMSPIHLKPPYLLFVGDEHRPSYAKTALGIVDWRPDSCAGQLRLSTEAVDLGLPDLSIDNARARGVQSLLIGTALVGGAIPDVWLDTLIAAARAGLDIIGGLHQRLEDVPALAAAARQSGARLIDVRTPPEALPVGTGKKRSGKRLLTVGTDCALGKKYTALQLEKEMRAEGAHVDFRASGQTGIMIAGQGLPLDAVISDFLSGAAEMLSPSADDNHWDVIEGQGAIFHPGYGAVSHGLLIGSQPDALVLCHHAGRTHVSGWPDTPLMPIKDVIQRNVDIAALTNPAVRCVGLSVNTAHLGKIEAEAYLADLSQVHGLPATDPIRFGCANILQALEVTFGPLA